MFLLMYLERNRFHRTIIHLYAFLDALLRVLVGSRARGNTQAKTLAPTKKRDGRERSSLLQKADTVASAARSYRKEITVASTARSY